MTILEEEAALRRGSDAPGGFPLNVPGDFPYNATSVVYENARLVKAGAGRLYGFTAYSSKASTQFILFLDANTIPADGAVPMVVFNVLTVSFASGYFGPMGRWFGRGIVVCNSSTGPTKTVGAADTWFDVQFA